MANAESIHPHPSESDLFGLDIRKAMSRTTKHPPKPDRFTKKHRTGGHQARSKRVLATLRYLRIEHLMPDYILTGIKRRAGEDCASSLRPAMRANVSDQATASTKHGGHNR